MKKSAEIEFAEFEVQKSFESYWAGIQSSADERCYNRGKIRGKMDKISQKLDMPMYAGSEICCSFGEVINKMQTMHRFLRKAVSVLIALLLIFATFPSCSVATITDTYTYDANGNMISGSGLIYIYNDVNQLIKIINESDSSTVAEYFYDSNGQRVKKIENGIITYYVGNIVETRVTGSTVDTTSYYFANNERVARKDPDGAMYYYHGDHLGSTHIVTDSTGAQSEKVSYYPYGSVKERVGEGSTYLYTDQEFDEESGLYYYGARYYDPELMRFIQPDTITQDVYNPQNLNRYSYVLNNPLKYIDPTGNFYLKGFITSGLGIIGGIAMTATGVALTSTAVGAPVGALLIVSGVAVTGTSLAGLAISVAIDEGDQTTKENFDDFQTISKAASNPIGLATGTGAVMMGEDEEGVINAMKAGNVIFKGGTMVVGGPPNPKDALEVTSTFGTFYEWYDMTDIQLVSSNQDVDKYDFSPIPYYTIPYYDPEYPYGIGADAKSYTSTTDYFGLLDKEEEII